MPKKLLDILSGAGAVSPDEIVEIRKEAAQKKVSIEDALIGRGVDEKLIIRAKSEALDIPSYSLSGKKINFDVLKLIPEESARHYQFVPLGMVDGVLEIGIVDPDNIEARDALQFISSKTGLPFKIYLIGMPTFEAIVRQYKGLSRQGPKTFS